MEGKFRNSALLIVTEIIFYGLILAGLIWYFLPQALA